MLFRSLEGTALALFLSLLVILDVAADEQVDNQTHEASLDAHTTKVHDDTNNGAGCESYTGCDEPTTDNTQYTCYTEYGTLAARSEEHTSELQSRFDLVCRLLLEKKKQKNQKQRRGAITTPQLTTP